MLLKVAQMVCHHANVRPPLFLQTDEHSHTDGMYACLPHTVKAVYAPFEFGLHATRVVYVIVRLVVGLLKTDDAVHAMRLQFGIFFGFQGHYFNLQVAEIRLCQVECAGNVRNACLGGIFTCNQQQVLKRRELLDSLVLIDNFLLRQYSTGHGIADVKPQYTQELVQEFVIYNGTNMEIVLPKRSSVYFLLKRAIVSK